METDELILGDQAKALDARISSRISESDRTNIWKSVNNILNSFTKGNDTILALGYVQSGKTTSITALCAAAADQDFQVIIAILGSTLLLRDQNRTRVEDYLGLEENNYRWVSITEFNQKRTAKEVSNWLGRDRVILIPPPAAEDCTLSLCSFGSLVHVVEHVEALGGTFKHVQPLCILFSKRSYQRG